MKLSMSSKSKKKKKKKGSNWNVKVKTAVSLFSPQNYLDILLNLHMDFLCKLVCSIKNRRLHNAHFINVQRFVQSWFVLAR